MHQVGLTKAITPSLHTACVMPSESRAGVFPRRDKNFGWASEKYNRQYEQRDAIEAVVPRLAWQKRRIGRFRVEAPRISVADVGCRRNVTQCWVNRVRRRTACSMPSVAYIQQGKRRSVVMASSRAYGLSHVSLRGERAVREQPTSAPSATERSKLAGAAVELSRTFCRKIVHSISRLRLQMAGLFVYL